MPVIKNLRVFRDGKYLTQAELAKRAGLSRAGIARLEAGGNAERKTVRLLAEALGVTPEELIGE